MYAIIRFVVREYDTVRALELPWSVANQTYATEHAIGSIFYSSGHLPSTVEEQLSLLRSQLSETDYQAIKFAEGQLTEQEYAPMRLQRQEWRNEYNALERGVALE